MTSPLSNLVICPGCGEDVPAKNNGCSDCGYQLAWPDGSGRILSVSEILAAPSYPTQGNLAMNQVSPRFLVRLTEAVAASSDAVAALERVAARLRQGGASLPAPKPEGTLESATTSGLCVALAVVEGEMKDMLEGASYACHIDLAEGEKPDSCVLDVGRPNDCMYARKYGAEGRHKCGEWRPVKVMS